MTRHTAIALSYDDSVEAPFIVAKGKNEIAERMLEIADTCGIRIIKDPILADILTDSQIGSCIPVETYEAVAAIFAFLEKGVDESWF